MGDIVSAGKILSRRGHRDHRGLQHL